MSSHLTRVHPPDDGLETSVTEGTLQLSERARAWITWVEMTCEVTASLRRHHGILLGNPHDANYTKYAQAVQTELNTLRPFYDPRHPAYGNNRLRSQQS